MSFASSTACDVTSLLQQLRGRSVYSVNHLVLGAPNVTIVEANVLRIYLRIANTNPAGTFFIRPIGTSGQGLFVNSFGPLQVYEFTIDQHPGLVQAGWEVSFVGLYDIDLIQLLFGG
jgi:hypothetical protein